jgi:hypothetical protein
MQHSKDFTGLITDHGEVKSEKTAQVGTHSECCCQVADISARDRKKQKNWPITIEGRTLVQFVHK